MRAAAVLLGLLLAAPAAPAQRVVTVTPTVSLVEHRVDAGFGVERSLGPVIGAVGAVQLGPRLTLALRALGGSLYGARSVLDRDVGELGLAARVGTTSWLDLEAGAARRTYATSVARQGWTLIHAGAAARAAFAGNAIAGVASAALLPVVSVPGLPNPDHAFRARTGIEYRIRSTRLAVDYSLERYDFPIQQGVRRLEQLSALTLRLDVRMR